MSDKRLDTSFRDPDGFLFESDGILYRQVNQKYKENYDFLLSSGLYNTLVDNGYFLPHIESDHKPLEPSRAYRVIKPEQLTFISYPYEWCFSQLKDAALAMLTIQKVALDYGMSLKDSSAYNIQLKNNKFYLIDTISFEIYKKGQPWVAYRQFCQHFLAPLALMSFCDVRLIQLLKVYIDGIPLDLASKLLPWRTRLIPSLFMHIHIHASAQKRYANRAIERNRVGRQMSKVQMLGLIDSLETGIKRLEWQPSGTEWASYYETDHHYTIESKEQKIRVVEDFLDSIRPKSVWDLGANTGLYSRLASERGIPTVSFDIDPSAVERNYLISKSKNENNLLPLLLDLTNPSPDIGWANKERQAILKRGPVDTVLALALIHHLAISNNVTLVMLADFFSKICNQLIIEFVPKSDPQVELLLATREDIFPGYTEESFISTFEDCFIIKDSVRLSDSDRCVFWMTKYRKTANNSSGVHG